MDEIPLLSLSYFNFDLFPDLDCYPGEIRLSDVSNYTSSEGFYYTSGYPVLCVNDQLVPLCNNTMPGLLEVSYICAVSSNLTCK